MQCGIIVERRKRENIISLKMQFRSTNVTDLVVNLIAFNVHGQSLNPDVSFWMVNSYLQSFCLLLGTSCKEN